MNILMVSPENAYLQDMKFLFYKGKLKVGEYLVISKEYIWRTTITEVIHAEGYDIGLVDYWLFSLDRENYNVCLMN